MDANDVDVENNSTISNNNNVASAKISNQNLKFKQKLNQQHNKNNNKPYARLEAYGSQTKQMTAAVTEGTSSKTMMTPATDAGEVNEQLANPEKRRTVVGAWKNVAEYEKVYVAIYGANANVDTKKQALSQIRVWSLRRSHLCPAAILATSVIIEVQIQDAESCPNLQTLYASAFTRFFNFMSSIMQTYNMRTMYDTAKQLGLNSFVVDLRHLCAHGQVLPPLQVLRKTAQYCLEWLEDYFWKDQLRAMTDADAYKIRRKDKSQFDDGISKLFGIYDTALECYMRDADTIKKCKSLVHGKRYVDLHTYWEHRKVKDFLELFDALPKDLRVLVKRETAIKDICEIFIEALLQMNYFFRAAEFYCNDDDYEKLLAVTQSLFRMLASIGYVEELFYALLRLTENPNEDDVRRKGASFWAVQIIEGFLAIRSCMELYKNEATDNAKYKDIKFGTPNASKRHVELMRELLIFSGVNMQQTLLFGDSMRQPTACVFDLNFVETHLESLNEYSAPVLKKLLPLVDPVMDEKDIESVCWLIDTLYKTSVLIKSSSSATPEQKNSVSETTSNDDKVYTAKDFLSVVESNTQTAQGGEEITVEEPEYGVWEEVPNDATHNWANCPLGRVPWN